jgi:hypothetical protein
MRRKTITVGTVILFGAIATTTANAQDHFAPGVANLRDYSVPPPGSYGALYNYGYVTSRFNDANGNQINSVTITGPNGRSATINLGVNLNAYALAPMFIWAPTKKVFGARYAAFISPSFSNANLSAEVSAARVGGLSPQAGQFNVGDTYVQPVWLDWGGKNYDLGYGFGFYIPTGSYQILNVQVPVVGDIRVASPSNTGLGFWENQHQGSLYIYPWADRRMAIENVVTLEINQAKRGFSLTPGQHFTWNWGISQYLPLKKDHSLLLEVGPAGYNSYQITDDSGADARNPGLHDHVDGAGAQLGITLPKQFIALNFHWFHEYSSVNRFAGTSYGVNFAVRLKAFKQ